MIRKIGLAAACLAAVLVIFAGATTFACGNHEKGIQSARAPQAGSCCAGHSGSCAGMSAGAGCAGMKMSAAAAGSGCGMKMSGNSGCGASMSTASSGCGMKAESAAGSCCGSHKAGAAKASYAANVYMIKDGHSFAAAQGKTFEVTPETPYTDVGAARYYFSDQAAKDASADKMATLTGELDREAAALAVAEGNTTVDKYGKKYAECPVMHSKFLVTATTPAKVVDGQKYYVCCDECLAEFSVPTHSAQ